MDEDYFDKEDSSFQCGNEYSGLLKKESKAGYGWMPAFKRVAPQIDMPQRVAHPINVNAPTRVTTSNRDDRLLLVFGASTKSSNDNDAFSAGFRQKGNSSCKACTQNNNSTLDKLNDLGILAKTCRRAGKHLQEAQAMYCRGVLYDNLERYRKALDCYEQYLRLCQRLQDFEGATAAYNCCAVTYYNLAVGGAQGADRAVGLATKDGANLLDDNLNATFNDFKEQVVEEKTEENSKARESSCKLLETSIAYSNKHFETGDEPGQFVALCNIGLCYSRLKDYSQALKYQQQALKLAIELRSPHGQSLTVGNLALVSAELKDWKTARACMDKHLHLVRELQNVEAESLACQQLGQMANKYGEFDDALQYFEEARKIARNAGERGMLKLITCSIGITSGNMRVQEYMTQLADQCNDDG